MLGYLPMSDDKVIEFIPRNEWEKKFAAEADKVIPLKEGDKPMRLSKELSRKRVVSAFMDAFELLGGTPALVEWAQASNENKTNFYKLYSRLLPGQATELDNSDKKTYIGHVLAKTSLDG